MTELLTVSKSDSNTTLNEVNLIAFKLISGELCLGILNEEEGEIKKCVKVEFGVNLQNPQQIHIALVPLLFPASTEPISVKLDDKIVAYDKVSNPELVREYIKVTSNLAVPDTQEVQKFTKPTVLS